MKKRLFYFILSCILTTNAFSQIAINSVFESSVMDAKNGVISIYHPNGYIYHFQSSYDNIYVKKINAVNFAPVGNAYRLNSNISTIIHNGFVDPNGFIIIYGSVFNQIAKSFIFKIDPNTLQIVNYKLVSDIIRDGCWGENNSNLPNQENIYAFVGINGYVFTMNTSLVYKTYIYGISSGAITDISWDTNSKRFLVSGNMGVYTCFMTFDCKDSYPLGYTTLNKICFMSSGLSVFQLPDSQYGPMFSRYVVHTLMNDGRVLVVHSGRRSNNYAPLIELSILSFQTSAPYTTTIDAYKSISFPVNQTITTRDLVNNILQNELTLHMTSWENDEFPGGVKEYLSRIYVNANNISFESRSLNPVCSISNLIYNPIDQRGGVNIGTGFFEYDYDGINSEWYLGMEGIMCYIHPYFDKHGCFSSQLTEITSLTPSTRYTSERIITGNFNNYNMTIPIFNVLNNFILAGYCNYYHSSLSNPTKELQNPNTEANIILFENQEFMLTGFDEQVNCQIFDMTGKQISSFVTLNETNNVIPSLSSGIYLLVAKDKKGNEKTVKFVK